ncbi:class I SAM-dependent methyltransferase [Acrocarpospora sp. B8E8]|uniref:class I SAM-dependent methyltransferase n=1 Tax=Acrocarpospora sp. B8E8 TaxID=3153572 RepID=UPI00325F4F38
MIDAIYDPLVWVLTTGRVHALRRAILAAAALQPGEDLLDVGCATGALTAAARELGGNTSRVVGVDISEPMLVRARRRAARAGADVDFTSGRAEKLPFPDDCFDAVVLSLVVHCMSADQATQAVTEARRVLRHGGRAVIADFGRSTGAASRLRAHLMLHGGVAASAPDLGALLSAGEFTDVRTQRSPISALTIARGTRLDD